MRDITFSIVMWSILEKFYRKFKERSEFGARLFGAMLGSATAVVLTHPFDIMKTRIEVQYC